MKKFAVIDIGSNSVRLMLLADGNVLYKRLETTRLGEDIAKTGILKPEAITRTAAAVARFFAQAKAEGASEVVAFATAATTARYAKKRGKANRKRKCALQKVLLHKFLLFPQYFSCHYYTLYYRACQ